MRDEVKDVVDDLRESAAQTYEPLSQTTIDVLNRAADLLETSTAAPAIDREALARFFDPWAWDYGDPSKGAVQVSRAESLAKADAVLDSGLLRDASDVRKEGYDEGWEDAILEFAPEHGQAILEARNG